MSRPREDHWGHRLLGRAHVPDQVEGKDNQNFNTGTNYLFQGSDEADLVPAREANVKCPQTVKYSNFWGNYVLM